MSRTKKCAKCENYDPVYTCVCGYSSPLTEESGMPLTNQGHRFGGVFGDGFDQGYRKGVEDAPDQIAIWNAAVRACQERVLSDGVQLHPELVELLEGVKKD